MAERNQAVLDMIGTLRARLADLEQDVRAYEGDLSYLVEKLDRIDDRVYLLETEIEGRDPAALGDAPARETEAAGADGARDVPADATDAEDADENGMNILTPEAKAKIGEAVGDMREIGREAAETFSSLNEAFSDITAPFKGFGKPGRRR